MMSNVVQEGPYLRNWYPGLGEVSVLKSFPRSVLVFIADAVDEDPDFLEEYLVPMLGEPDALDRICSDLSNAVMDYELQSSGMGELGYLGKSFFKKVAKAVKKVVTAPIKIAKKEIQAVEKVGKAIAKVGTKAVREVESVGRAASKVTTKVWKKYGNTIIQVAGAVLAPFTGGASLAAAAVLTAANTAYAKKRQADTAKKMASQDAAQVQAEADQANQALTQQVNDFYNQNQDWFLQYGMTPDKWAGLTLDQKIEFINAGAEGRLPRDPGPAAPQTSMPTQMPSGGFTPQMPSMGPSPGASFPSGGGSGDPSSVWGGSGIGPSGATSSYQPGGGGGGAPQTAKASMFDGQGGMMLPALLVAGAVMLSSGKKGGGSRRRRNPPRRRRW